MQKPCSLRRRLKPKGTKVEDYEAGDAHHSVATFKVRGPTVLDERVAQRWTGVYRLAADGHLINVALVDKPREVCPSDLLSFPTM